MNAQLTNGTKTGLYIPEDLRLMAEDRTLVYLVLQALHTIEWPKAFSNAKETEGAPDPVLRTLTLYCYAAGIWGSRDIAFAATSDPTAKYICAGDVPDWAAVRQFRRHNSHYLKLALIELLRLVFKNAVTEQDACGMFTVRRLAEGLSGEFTRDAEFRLRQAIQADSMASDE